VPRVGVVEAAMVCAALALVNEAGALSSVAYLWRPGSQPTGAAAPRVTAQ
jgi:hypothetical protein